MTKNIFYLSFIALFLSFYTEGVAQVAINTDGSQAGANTILDLNPAVGKAFVPPTMNWAQIKAISPARAGMVVYDSEFNCLRMYNGTKWICVGEQKQLTDPPGNFTTLTNGGPDWSVFPGVVITDASGNVYVGGNFSNTVTFGTLPPTAIWAKRAGGAGTHYSTGHTIALDAANNIYIAGTFAGTATFEGTVSITSTGGNDIFIAKYDNNGTALWAQKAGGVKDEYAADLALDASGNIYIAGTFAGTATFGTLSITASNTLDDDYIAKYNNNGVSQWVQRTGATKIWSEDSYPSIALDASGNIYISGEFTGTATFGTLSPITSAGGYDVYLAKYNNTGTPIWVQRAGGIYTDYPSYIALDAAGNVYFTVMFEGSATFGTLPTIYAAGGYNPNSGYDNYDVCIVKYSSTGTPLWIQKGGGAKQDYIGGVTVDVSGNVYTVGAFHPTAQFGNQIFTSGSMFLMKYSE